MINVNLTETNNYNLGDLIDKMDELREYDCKSYLVSLLGHQKKQENFEKALKDEFENNNITINDFVSFIENLSISEYDIVSITNLGSFYTTYASFFEEYEMNTKLASHYCYGYSPSRDAERFKSMKFVVLKNYPHTDSGSMCYVITPYDAWFDYEKNDFGRVFIIGEGGIKKCGTLKNEN